MATHSGALAWKIPWMEKPGAGYNPWGRKESDMTERLHFHFSLSLSKLIYGFNTILIKILAGVFAEMDKPILKFT